MIHIELRPGDRISHAGVDYRVLSHAGDTLVLARSCGTRWQPDGKPNSDLRQNRASC
jgi:hypothetical protein